VAAAIGFFVVGRSRRNTGFTAISTKPEGVFAKERLNPDEDDDEAPTI